MLKWAVTPRCNSEIFEHDGIFNGDNYELLTLQDIIEQHQLPCLVKLVNDDINESIDNYCLFLCETNEPYLIVSNETERFSVPISFDGLFAPVERGITRYNILDSIRSLQLNLKSPYLSSEYSQFTTLQPYMAYSNSAFHRIQAGTILEPYYRTYQPTSSPSPSPSSSSSSTTTTTSNRLRTLFANIPHSFNKHILSNYNQTRSMKKQFSSNDYFDVKTNQHEEIFTLKSDSDGAFVPIYSQIPTKNSSSYYYHSLNQIQGLYTTELLSQLTDQYPLITELIISRTLEENISTTDGYPFRRITLHRFVNNHPRIIAFDMKNYAFIEIDTKNSTDTYAIEHDKTLFQRYQAQLRWCHKHLSSFRSQIKTIIHSSNGTPVFIQATPFHGQQLQQYHQRRNSSSVLSSPLIKHTPHTIFTSQESISSSRLRAHTPILSKFDTTSYHSKYEPKHRYKGRTINSTGTKRKDVRFYFDQPVIQRHFQTKHSSYRINSIGQDSIDADDDDDTNSFQCTPL